MPRSEHSATAQSIPRVLPHAPDELAAVRLRRLGEGVGKVAYTSGHWVVKRERTRLEVIAIIAVWRLLRRLERFLPGALGRRLRSRPAGQIRLLRAIAYAVVLVLPRGLWFSSHLGDVWRLYRKRAAEGDRLARQHLEDTGLVPRRVTFPPMRVKIDGWPGWLTVSEASERVEATLYHRLTELAKLGRYDEIEVWLDRFLELRQAGWRRGVFSVDAHLKNFGVTGDRVVLLDTGGLTANWADIEHRLLMESSTAKPHLRLGLGPILKGHPVFAQHFNMRWKQTVSHETLRRVWPATRLPA